MTSCVLRKQNIEVSRLSCKKETQPMKECVDGRKEEGYDREDESGRERKRERL